MLEAFVLNRCDDWNQGKSASGLNGNIFFQLLHLLFLENMQGQCAKNGQTGYTKTELLALHSNTGQSRAP